MDGQDGNRLQHERNNYWAPFIKFNPSCAAKTIKYMYYVLFSFQEITPCLVLGVLRPLYVHKKMLLHCSVDLTRILTSG